MVKHGRSVAMLLFLSQKAWLSIPYSIDVTAMPPASRMQLVKEFQANFQYRCRDTLWGDSGTRQMYAKCKHFVSICVKICDLTLDKAITTL